MKNLAFDPTTCEICGIDISRWHFLASLKATPVVTLINVFTVDSSKQDELVKVLDDATERALLFHGGNRAH